MYKETSLRHRLQKGGVREQKVQTPLLQQGKVSEIKFLSFLKKRVHLH